MLKIGIVCVISIFGLWGCGAKIATGKALHRAPTVGPITSKSVIGRYAHQFKTGISTITITQVQDRLRYKVDMDWSNGQKFALDWQNCQFYDLGDHQSLSFEEFPQYLVVHHKNTNSFIDDDLDDIPSDKIPTKEECLELCYCGQRI